MSKLKRLAGETVLYGLGSILPRMLNYLPVPLHTKNMFSTAEYGEITKLYAFVGVINIVYMFAMETAYFRFATKPGADAKRIFNLAQTSVIIINRAASGPEPAPDVRGPQWFAPADRRGGFSGQAERAGLGIVDGALFDLCYERIRLRQSEGKPFFLATLTLSTHHPFAAPLNHPDVQLLQQQVQDKYVAALRYTDLELERVFTRLVREGLLRNTVVVILGDHGRHEPVGSTDIERKAGHFASQLFIWMDESLRTPATYRPRPVSTIASQVDLAPTLLALNGGLPAIGSFAGHDLSCVLVRDCLPNQVAYHTSVYDTLVGLASAEGLLLYSFATAHFQEATLNFEPVSDEQTGQRQLPASRDRELMALYEVANVALDSNRLWSWREFGTRL